MGELQYAVNQDKNADGPAGHLQARRLVRDGRLRRPALWSRRRRQVVSLADPTVAGPLNHRGDWGIYGIADQMVWRADKASLNLFLRGGLSPSDRNLISFYVDGGFGIKGPLPGRADDVLTFGVAYAKISTDASALDQDTLALNGPPYPIRDEEVVFEAELPGADRAVVDRAAGSAIHRASRRQCARSEQCQC